MVETEAHWAGEIYTGLISSIMIEPGMAYIQNITVPQTVEASAMYSLYRPTSEHHRNTLYMPVSECLCNMAFTGQLVNIIAIPYTCLLVNIFVLRPVQSN